MAFIYGVRNFKITMSTSFGWLRTVTWHHGSLLGQQLTWWTYMWLTWTGSFIWPRVPRFSSLTDLRVNLPVIKSGFLSYFLTIWSNFINWKLVNDSSGLCLTEILTGTYLSLSKSRRKSFLVVVFFLNKQYLNIWLHCCGWLTEVFRTFTM